MKNMSRTVKAKMWKLTGVKSRCSFAYGPQSSSHQNSLKLFYFNFIFTFLLIVFSRHVFMQGLKQIAKRRFKIFVLSIKQQIYILTFLDKLTLKRHFTTHTVFSRYTFK